MLIWQHQKYEQCWITALSIVTGESVSTLLTHYAKLSHSTYDELLANPNGEWYRYAVRLLIPYHSKTITNYNSYVPSPTGYLYVKPAQSLTPKYLMGQGILTLYRTHAAHAMAFHNKLITDSACVNDNHQTLAEFKHNSSMYKRITRWRIDYLKTKR